MFTYAIVGLIILAAFFILLPTLKHFRKGPFSDSVREAENIALYRERLAELSEELDQGLIEHPQFEELMLELQRGFLDDVKVTAEDSAPSSAPSTAFSRAVPLLITVLIPLVSYNMYAHWGYEDDIRLTDVYQKAVHNVREPEQVSALLLSLNEAVQKDPQNAWAWYFLGKNYFSLNLYEDAANAYQKAIPHMRYEGDKIMVMGQYVLASFMLSNRSLTDATRTVIDEALALNPNDYTILRVLATDAQQRQDYPEAIKYWRQLIRINPGTSAADVMQSNIIAAEKIMNAGADAPTEGSLIDRESTTVAQTTSGSAAYAAKADTLKNGSAANGPVIDVLISLAEGIELPSDQRIFVAVRNSAKQGVPPLAAVDLRVADLPARISLDNSSAVGPFNLSSAEEVYVSALASLKGVASPQSGDYRVLSDSFAHNNQRVEIALKLSEKIP